MQVTYIVEVNDQWVTGSDAIYIHRSLTYLNLGWCAACSTGSQRCERVSMNYLLPVGAIKAWSWVWCCTPACGCSHTWAAHMISLRTWALSNYTLLLAIHPAWARKTLVDGSWHGWLAPATRVITYLTHAHRIWILYNHTKPYIHIYGKYRWLG